MGTGLDRETLEMTLGAIDEFAESTLNEQKLLDLDHDDEFPEEIVRAMCGEGLGIQLLFIPEEYGGMGGGAFDVYRLCERMAHIDLGIATGVLATFLGSDPIVVGGTDEQRGRWLTKLAEEGLLMAYAATEPEAGSDLAALRTTATPVRENGEIKAYRINGNKQWISNGGYADLYTVLALAPGGPSWFVVEKGAPGLGHGKPEDKHGIRMSNTATVSFEDVEVPPERLLGGVEGQGLHQAQLVFGYTRLMVAAFGLGAGWEAIDRAIRYSTERKVAGSLLSEKQGYTHKLIVPHAVHLEASRAFIEETALRIDGGEGSLNTEGAISKYMATESGNAAAECAIQAFGGYGYTREYLVEKIKRDVRITTIYEGTSEIMEMTIGRDRWQEHLKTRGAYYHEKARECEDLHASHPAVGADVAAIGLHALAELLEAARIGRLTRNQHVLFRLGHLMAFAESASAMARRAALAADGKLDDKADTRFDSDALAAIGRVFARDAAQRVGVEGVRLVLGAAESERGGFPDLERGLRLGEIHRAQTGLLADMTRIADHLYDRLGA